VDFNRGAARDASARSIPGAREGGSKKNELNSVVQRSYQMVDLVHSRVGLFALSFAGREERTQRNPEKEEKKRKAARTERAERHRKESKQQIIRLKCVKKREPAYEVHAERIRLPHLRAPGAVSRGLSRCCRNLELLERFLFRDTSFA
jgi:hypothetical protein